MKRCLLNWIYGETEVAHGTPTFDVQRRMQGRDWPPTAHTMIGLARLENIQHCVQTILDESVPGDLLEAGVWRGGATIFMRAVLQAFGVANRRIWVADSFAGLPPPNPTRYPHDEGLDLHRWPQLSVSLEQVQANFARYGLLDDQVRFLKGWFRESLGEAPINQLAVLRVDCDLYESTTDTLTQLYPKVAVGGFVIVDDYYDISACRHAIDDYRKGANIEDPLLRIDWTGVYWRRIR